VRMKGRGSIALAAVAMLTVTLLAVSWSIAATDPAESSGFSSSSADKATGSPFVLSEPKPVAPFPILLNQSVQNYLHDYLNQPEWLVSAFDRSRPYLPEMVRVLRQYRVPDDLVYLAFAESAFSRRGRGPWQLSGATAKHYGLRIDRYVDERRDPILSTRAAAEYLAELHDAAGFDWRVAIVGWNGGTAAIDRFWLLRGSNFNRFTNLLPVPTRTLLGRFMAVAFIAHNAIAYGIRRVDLDESPSYREVKVKGGARLAQIAQAFGSSVSKLRELNPALRRDLIPPYAHGYKIRVPLVQSAAADGS